MICQNNIHFSLFPRRLKNCTQGKKAQISGRKKRGIRNKFIMGGSLKIFLGEKGQKNHPKIAQNISKL